MKTDLAGTPFILNATILDAQVIMGNLILALKHPANRGPSSKVAARIARDIFESLKSVDYYEPWEIAETERDFMEAGINLNSN